MIIIIIIAIMTIIIIRYKCALRPNQCNLRTVNRVIYLARKE